MPRARSLGHGRCRRPVSPPPPARPHPSQTRRHSSSRTPSASAFRRRLLSPVVSSTFSPPSRLARLVLCLPDSLPGSLLLTRCLPFADFLQRAGRGPIDMGFAVSQGCLTLPPPLLELSGWGQATILFKRLCVPPSIQHKSLSDHSGLARACLMDECGTRPVARACGRQNRPAAVSAHTQPGRRGREGSTPPPTPPGAHAPRPPRSHPPGRVP